MHQSGRPVCGGRETLASPRPQKIIRPAHTPLKSDFYNKIGQKRTFEHVRVMSALPPKADIGLLIRSPRQLGKALLEISPGQVLSRS